MIFLTVGNLLQCRLCGRLGGLLVPVSWICYRSAGEQLHPQTFRPAGNRSARTWNAHSRVSGRFAASPLPRVDCNIRSRGARKRRGRRLLERMDRRHAR